MKTGLNWLLPMLLCVGAVSISNVAAGEKAKEKSKGKVLVVVSSTSSLTLKDGLKHPTGFFLNELGVPTKAIVDAGFEPVFCDPLGNTPSMDTVSDKPAFSAKDEKEYESIKSFVDGLAQLKHPLKLSDVASKDLDQYAGLFVPGGHAPMEDLWKDPSLGKILRHLHEMHKPTALICHGPIALMSALANPAEVVKSLDAGEKSKKKPGWIYSDYKMTVFSTAEEKPNEAPKATLGGFMQFYPEPALKASGGDVTEFAAKQSHVVVDKELITGQNPYSDKELAAAFVKALKAQN